MAISVTVNKQNIKYDKLIANTLHLMPLGIQASKICTNKVLNHLIFNLYYTTVYIQIPNCQAIILIHDWFFSCCMRTLLFARRIASEARLLATRRQMSIINCKPCTSLRDNIRRQDVYWQPRWTQHIIEEEWMFLAVKN